MPQPVDGDPPAHPSETDLWVSVVRAGGFAGLVRRWQVTAGPEDHGRWCALVDACPWDQTPAPAPDGADRFTWSITAGDDAGERTAHLAEHEVQGPWRALVDAVHAAEQAGRPERSAGATGSGSASEE